jgi:pimeloyl-ACP methyl ester carboxylesterase
MELAARQPDLVRALMLDGVPVFDDRELSTWFDGFIPPLVPDKQGGHFAAVWTRCRDQSVWFPWSYKEPDHMMSQGVASPERIQSTVMSIMRCGRTYLPAFRSAVFYAPRVPGTMAKITQPTMITCAKGDPLSAHLDRLPALKPSQLVRKLPTGAAVRELRDEWLARYAGAKRAQSDLDIRTADPNIRAQIVQLSDGREVFLRVAGRPGRRAVILIHDAPGSSRMHEPLIAALAANARVFALDLPGCGESDPLLGKAPATGDFAEIIRALTAQLGIQQASVYGVGFGSSVALEFAERYPKKAQALVLQSLLLPSPSERSDMEKNYAPPIELKADGSHWYATWLMLRDSLAFWPWYQSASANRLRRVDLSDEFSADHLHDWTVEVMKQFASYQHPINAALGQDGSALLGQVACKIVVCTDPRHPFAVYDEDLVASLPSMARVGVAADPTAHVAEILRLITL